MPGHRQVGRLGQQVLDQLNGEGVGQPAPLLLGAHPNSDVGRPALVAAARGGDPAQRHPPRRPRRQRLRQWRRIDRCQLESVCGAGDLDTFAVRAHGDVRYLTGVDVAGGEHPVHLTVAGRCGDSEARIARKRQFHCSRGELAPDIRRVGVTDHAAQQRAGRLLGVGVVVVGAGQGPLQLGGLDGGLGNEQCLQLPSHQRRLLLYVQAGQHERHRVTEAADAVQRHLVRGWRRLAGHAADPHPVGAVIGQRNGVHPGGGIGVGVSRAGDLVEQLRGDGVDADQAAGAGVLGDHRRAVGVDLGQGETGVEQARDRWNFGKEREIAAGGLDAAFDDVAGDHGAGQAVVVGPGPAEVRGRGPDGHRRIGHPAGDDDVRAPVQAVDDAPGAQVGVGRQRRAQPEFRGAGGQVVTVDVGDPDRHSQALGQSAHGVGEPGGVQAARVGDDAHPAVVGQPQALLELGQEGLGVAAIGMLHPVAAENQHGQLGQVITGQVVEPAADQHLAHRGQPIAVEPRAVPDANRRRGSRGPGIRRRSHPVALLPADSRPPPTNR